MLKIFNRNNAKIVILLMLSVFLAGVFVLLMDLGLLKTLYDLYNGETEVGDYFNNQGININTVRVLMSIYSIVIDRYIYSVLPIGITLFLFGYYHSKSFSKMFLSRTVFEKNKDLQR